MRAEFSTVFGILLRKKSLIAGAAALAAADALIAVGVPYLSRIQIEVLEKRYGSLAAVLRDPWTVFAVIICLLAVMKLLQAFFSGIGRVLDVHAREYFTLETDRVIYDKMETMDAGFFQNPRNRRLLYVLFEVGALAGSVLQFGKAQGRIAISLIGMIPIIALVDVRVFGIIIAASLLQFVVLRFRMRRENDYRLFKERRLADIVEMKFLLRYHYHQVLGVSGEGRIMPRYWSKVGEQVTLETGHERLLLRFQLVNALLEQASLAAASLLIGMLVIGGSLSIGAFAMVTMYAVHLHGSFTDVAQGVSDWYRLRSVFHQLGFFLALKPRVAIPVIDEPREPLEGAVEAADVVFRYPVLTGEECDYLAYLVRNLKLANGRREIYGSDLSLANEWQRLLDESRVPNPLVLNGVTCRFERGQITALVGRNGSGKTTLMNLLMRSYDPERGAVAIGGRALAGSHPASVRHAISMVAQTPFLLESYSLRDNLLLGADRDIDDEGLWRILEDLGIAHELRRFPGGLDSVVGDEVNLSGGQAQLVCIARVIAQNRSIVILDEGTNQLDAENELRIIEKLQELKRDAAVIIITHRMTTARKADRIYVMDGGRIVESGGHDELLRIEGGLYRGFWEMQVVR